MRVESLSAEPKLVVCALGKIRTSDKTRLMLRWPSETEQFQDSNKQAQLDSSMNIVVSKVDCIGGRLLKPY